MSDDHFRVRQLEELEALAAIFEGGLVVDDPSVGAWVDQRTHGSDAVSINVLHFLLLLLLDIPCTWCVVMRYLP